MVYSKRFLDKWVQKFLNKVFSPKLIVQTAEEKKNKKKKQVAIVLSYMGMISN